MAQAVPGLHYRHVGGKATQICPGASRCDSYVIVRHRQHEQVLGALLEEPGSKERINVCTRCGEGSID